MKCPKCAGAATDFRTSEGIVVNFCSGCHGLWFDEGELALYCETQHDIPNLQALLPQAQATVYACPRCQETPLVELLYLQGEQVLIDWCPTCHGAWLDAREIMQIETLATRHEDHTLRLRRGVQQLTASGYRPMLARPA